MRGFLAVPWAALLFAGAVPAAAAGASVLRLNGRQAWHPGEAIVARKTTRTASGLPDKAEMAAADVRGHSDLELVLASRGLPSKELPQVTQAALLQGRATSPASTLGYAEDSTHDEERSNKAAMQRGKVSFGIADNDDEESFD
mmetsp:Transcript_56714/g.122085  ORF Transcript_56714/g.122085 Transcript_56714/m.122085 type:complete len:143 (-) Transcript_56714:104-532(-)